MRPEDKVPLLSSIKQFGQTMIAEGTRAVKERDWPWLAVWVIILLAILYGSYLGWLVLYNNAYPKPSSHNFSTTTVAYLHLKGNELDTEIDLDGSGTLLPFTYHHKKRVSVLQILLNQDEPREIDLSNEIVLLLNPKKKTFDDPIYEGEYLLEFSMAFDPANSYLFNLERPSNTIVSDGRAFVVRLAEIRKLAADTGFSYKFQITER